MFKIKVIDDCPVTRGSSGLITFDKDAIAMIAGAVRDQDEWAVFLNGTRSEDGFVVTVDRLTVPVQVRGGADVEIPEQTIADDVVGVMHSHHRMGAFFSGTDTGQLNPRFPSSVVVAIAANNLGFSYQAEGKVILPCGAIGKVDFQLGVRDVDARFMPEVIRGSEIEKPATQWRAAVPDLGECDRYEVVDGDWTEEVKAVCGVQLVQDRPAVFGLAGEGLMATINQMATRRTYLIGKGKGSKKGKGGKNGLVKLERPGNALDQVGTFGDNAVGNQFVKGGCDGVGCDARGVLLKFFKVTRDWLCKDCYADYVKMDEAGADWQKLADDDDVVIIHGDGEEESYSLKGDGHGGYLRREM